MMRLKMLQHRGLAAFLPALLLSLGGLQPAAAAPSGALTFHVDLGYEEVSKGAEFEAFLPDTLTVDAGDTIVFTLRSHEPHTVTFEAPKPLPEPFFPLPDQNLAVNPQLFLPAPMPGSPLPDPEDPVHLSVATDGAEYLNSGFLQHPGDTFSVTFTKPGTYQAVCLLHPQHMKGTITVNPAGSPRPMTDEAYQQQALAQVRDFQTKEQALLAGIRVPEPTVNPDGTRTYTVYAGVGEAEQGIDLMEFVGGQHLAIKAGDSVTFVLDKNDQGVPHTITFLSGGQDEELVVPQPQPSGPPRLIVNPQVLRPSPIPPAPYEGKGYFNSGLLLTGSPGPQAYTVKFTKPGSFEYMCVLHDEGGMKGVIAVSP
jgi:plastocyanin